MNSVWQAAMPTPDTSMPLPDQRIFTTWEISSHTSALCDAIPVMWQNTDVQVLALLGNPITGFSANAPTTTIISITTGSWSNAVPVHTGITSNVAEMSTNKPTLSNGAKSGIRIAIPIVMLALFLGIFFYFRSRNNQQEAQHELHADELDLGRLNHLQKQELLSKGTLLEMDANRETVELESVRVVHEMPDTSIPKLSIRDTTRALGPPPSNYITDIISKRLSAPDLASWSRFDPNAKGNENAAAVPSVPRRGLSSTSPRNPNFSALSCRLPEGQSSAALVDGTDIVSPISAGPMLRWSNFTMKAERPTSITNIDDSDVVSRASDTAQCEVSTVFVRGVEDADPRTSSQVPPPFPKHPPTPPPPTTHPHPPPPKPPTTSLD